MRRVLYAIGGIVFALAAAGVGMMVYKAVKLNNEATAYVDEAIPAISAHWNASELLERGTPELKKDAPPDVLAKLFRTLEPLRRLTKYEGAKGSSNTSYSTDTGTSITGDFVATAEYENGTATFDVVVVKRNGQWMINGFHYDAKLKPDAALPKGT